MHQPFIRY